MPFHRRFLPGYFYPVTQREEPDAGSRVHAPSSSLGALEQFAFSLLFRHEQLRPISVGTRAYQAELHYCVRCGCCHIEATERGQQKYAVSNHGLQHWAQRWLASYLLANLHQPPGIRLEIGTCHLLGGQMLLPRLPMKASRDCQLQPWILAARGIGFIPAPARRDPELLADGNTVRPELEILAKGFMDHMDRKLIAAGGSGDLLNFTVQSVFLMRAGYIARYPE